MTRDARIIFSAEDKTGPATESARRGLVGVSEAAGRVQLSSREMAFAMRGLPAQFTDIWTSIAAGQNPLTVLIQQGGQIKDMFGGVGNAARAMGGYIASLVSPTTVAAAAIGGLAFAAHKGQEELRKFQNEATMSGNVIGMSASMFTQAQEALLGIAGTRGKAAEALTAIASSGMSAAVNIKGVAEASILMEKATGQSVEKTIAMFQRLEQDPVKAVRELDKQYNFLTASVYKQIKALEEEGSKQKAAEIASDAMAKAFVDRSRTVIQNVGTMEKAWRGLAGAAKFAWDQMLNVGREKSLADRFAEASKAVAKAGGPFDPSAFGGNAEARAMLPANRASMQSLFRQMEIEQRNASAAVAAVSAERAAKDAIDAQDARRVGGGGRGRRAPRPTSSGMGPDRRELIRLEREYTAAQEEAQRIADQLWESRDRLMSQDDKRAVSAQKLLEDIEFETQMIGLSNVEREKAIALRELERTGLDQTSEAYQKLAEDIANAVDQRSAAKASAEAHKAAAGEAQKTWSQVSDAFVDALMKGGKSVAQYLKNLFRTLVLRPILAPVGQAMSNFMGGGGGGAGGGGYSSIAGMFGGSGGGTGGGIMSQIGGSGMNNLGMVGAGYQALTGASVGASAASLGYANVVGAVGGDALGAMIAANGSWAGVSAGAAGASAAGAGAAGAGAAAGGGAAAGAGMAAAIPVIGWVVAIAAILYSLFGNKGGGPKAEGFYNPYDSGQYFSSNSPEVGASSRKAAKALQSQYDAIAKTYGGGGLQFGMGFSADPAGDDQTMLRIGAGRNGAESFNFYNSEVGRDEDDLQKAIGEMSSRAILKGLQQSNLADEIGKYLQSLGDIAALAFSDVEEALARVQKASAERQSLQQRWDAMVLSDAEKLAATRKAELEAVDRTNKAMVFRVHALEDEFNKHNAIVSAFTELSSVIEGFRADISAYLDNLNATPAGMLSPEAQLANAKAQFTTQLAMAKSGNRGALQGITGYADQLISAQTGFSASGSATADLISYVKQALGGLSDTITGEEFIARAIGVSTNTLAEVMETAAGGTTSAIQTMIARADENANRLIAAYNTSAGIDAQIGAGAVYAPAQQEIPQEVIRARSEAFDAEFRASLAGMADDAQIEASLEQARQLYGNLSGAKAAALMRVTGSGFGDGYAVGTNYVPYTMVTRVHEGERIIPKRDNPYANPYTRDQDQSAPLLQKLLERVENLTAVVAEGERRNEQATYRVAENTAASARSVRLATAEAPL